MNIEIPFHPIGYVHSKLEHRYETPRQGVLAGDELSFIELLPQNNFEQAVMNLDGFERIWVIYNFHLNSNWKPLVSPPRHTRNKVGVFASRAPYRPNPIGLSCVKLEKIGGLKIYISESDILNGSPVLDIKPYLPYSDSFPNSITGWVKNDILNRYEIEWNSEAMIKAEWLKNKAKINLPNFVKLQLEFNPTDDSRKRISRLGEVFTIAYRTWRINYIVIEELKRLLIKNISSGYSAEELNDPLDIYSDKPLHLEFFTQFPS